MHAIASHPSRPAMFGLDLSRGSGLARLGVFLAIAVSGVVFSEPAPVDLVMLGLIVALPLLRMQTYAPGMVLQMLLWLGCGAGALIAASASQDIGDSARHTGISFYLYGAFLVIAAYVAHRPEAHARLIFRAWVLGAMVAAIAGLIGYFHALPGAYELFTKFGRVAGTFKDPNVIGPFLVPAVLFLGHRVLHRETRFIGLELAAVGLLIGAILLSFSRGAWLNLLVGVVAYGAMTLVTVGSAVERTRIVIIATGAVLLAALAILAVLQLEQVATLLAERWTLTQSYDVGPEGRFGGQEKALALLLANPLGLGAKQFALHFHPEDVHNVYLSMFLNAGWLGGLLYIAAIGSTIWAGLGHVLKATATRPLFLIAFAAFLANVVEGVIIDTDHWRHFYFLLALVWGLMGAAREPVSEAR